MENNICVNCGKKNSCNIKDSCEARGVNINSCSQKAIGEVYTNFLGYSNAEKSTIGDLLCMTTGDTDWNKISSPEEDFTRFELSIKKSKSFYCKAIANTDMHESGALDIYEDKKHSGFYYFNKDGIKTYIKRKSFKKINVSDDFTDSPFSKLADIFKDHTVWDTLKIGKNMDRKANKDFVKFDSEKPMYHLVDPYAHEDLAKLLTFGAKKYTADNWKKGDIKTYISALERHLSDIKKAIDSCDYSLFIDKDSSLQHGAALMCNSMFIQYFIEK